MCILLAEKPRDGEVQSVGQSLQCIQARPMFASLKPGDYGLIDARALGEFDLGQAGGFSMSTKSPANRRIGVPGLISETPCKLTIQGCPDRSRVNLE